MAKKIAHGSDLDRLGQFAIAGIQAAVRLGEIKILWRIFHLVKGPLSEKKALDAAAEDERRRYPDGQPADLADALEAFVRKGMTPPRAVICAMQMLPFLYDFVEKPSIGLFDLDPGARRSDSEVLKELRVKGVKLKIPRRPDGEAFVRAGARALGMSAARAHHLFDRRDKRAKRQRPELPTQLRPAAVGRRDLKRRQRG